MKIGELSGSLTNLLDGTSYLIAGANVTIASESNGAITISSTGGGGPAGDQFFFSSTSGSLYSSGSLALVGGGDEWGVIDSPSDKGTDVFFYVSGSIGSKDGGDPGTSLFGGDVVISGSFFSEGDIVEMTGSLTVTNGISGSLTNLPDGTSYLIAGNNISIVSQSNGSILISSTGGGGDSFFASTVDGSIFTTGSAAFRGQESVSSPSDKGTDVFFYVSGSIGSKDGPTPGTALFGGDVVVSGSLFTQGNVLEVTGTIIATQGISGSLTTLDDGTSYLVAGNNISIMSQSNGSIIISSSTPVLVYRPGGVDTDNVYSTWASLMSAFAQTSGIVFIDVDTSITPTATVPVGTYEFESRVILRGTQTGILYPSRFQMPDGAVIKNPREFQNIWLDMLSTTTPNFEFDIDDRAIKFSGLSYIEMNGTQPFADISAALPIGLGFTFVENVLIGNFAPVNRCFINISNASSGIILTFIDNIIINNDNFIAGVAGSTLSVYYDSSVSVSSNPSVYALPTNPNFAGTVFPPLALNNAKLTAYDDLFAGTTELSASTVQVAIDVLKNRWSSSVPNFLFTTSSIAVIGNEPNVDAATDKGADVFFYVSGSQGSKGGANPGAALFGGDVVISGTLHGGSPLKIGSGVQITGSLSQGDGAQAIGLFSHAEGNGSVALGIFSHAEGEESYAGTFGYLANVTTPGLIVLDSSYGDVSAEFFPGSYIILDDNNFDANYYHRAFKLVSAVFNTPSTEVTLVDSTVTTTTAIIGLQAYKTPPLADYVIGNISHAEGVSIAQGPYSHAESGGRAIGEISHAEGVATALGYGSHAECDGIAVGDYSHAEGVNYSTAAGYASHAEGSFTMALGDYSHAANLYTIASGSAQTVIGKYNLRDNDFSLFVVGNGTGLNNVDRSDVFRVNQSRVEVTGSFVSTMGLSGSLTKLADGSSYLIAGPNVTITSQSNGSVLIAATTQAPTDASYLVLGANATLTTERTFTPGAGLLGTDGGANGSYTLAINDNVVATISGSAFSGVTRHAAGLSGSLTKLTDGSSYLIAGPNISITTGSNGAVTISNTFSQVDDYFDSTTAGSIFTTGSAAFRGQEPAVDSPSDKGTDVFFYVSGSISGQGLEDRKSLFGGDLVVSGSLFAQGDRLEMSGTLLVTEGISGSLTNLTDGSSYLIAGSNVTITSQSNGSVLIAAATQAPIDASYLVLGSNTTLTTERTFTPGTGLLGTDAGANGSYTLAINNNVVATLTGSEFSGDIAVNGGDITSTAATFNLLNSAVTTLNFGGAATSVTMGATPTATTTIRGGTLVGDATTQNLFNTVATTLNVGGAATSITLGDSTTATTTIRGGTLVGNATTQNLFNTTATTLNMGGAATVVEIGATSGTTSINNDLTVDGNTTLGNATSDTVTFTARVASSVLPSSDNVHDLGSPSNRWANVYTGDLHLRNDRGDWTVIEEEAYLTIRNNKTGRMFKLVMEPLDVQE